MLTQDTAAPQPLAAISRRQQPQAMPTSAQIRAARGLLGWSQADLAQRAHLHPRTIERAERGAGITVRTLRAIAGALEAGGIEFLQNQNGLGVRLRRR